MVVDDFTISEGKTKEVKQVLSKLVGDSTAVILLADRNEPVENAARNLDNAMTLRAMYLNIRDLLSHDRLIIPLGALEVLNAWLGKNQAE